MMELRRYVETERCGMSLSDSTLCYQHGGRYDKEAFQQE